jgi:hypothetical protein
MKGQAAATTRHGNALRLTGWETVACMAGCLVLSAGFVLACLATWAVLQLIRQFATLELVTAE